MEGLMNFLITDKHYSEIVQNEPSRCNTTYTCKKATIYSKDYDGLIGICQLADLFFSTAKQHANQSIQHSTEIVRIENPYVCIKITDSGEASEPAKKALHYSYSTSGGRITSIPALHHMVIRCQEAVLAATTDIYYPDMPECLGSSAYIKDTTHEWSLILSGENQKQTFTWRAEEQEHNI